LPRVRLPCTDVARIAVAARHGPGLRRRREWPGALPLAVVERQWPRADAARPLAARLRRPGAAPRLHDVGDLSIRALDHGALLPPAAAAGRVAIAAARGPGAPPR